MSVIVDGHIGVGFGGFRMKTRLEAGNLDAFELGRYTHT